MCRENKDIKALIIFIAFFSFFLKIVFTFSIFYYLLYYLLILIQLEAIGLISSFAYMYFFYHYCCIIINCPASIRTIIKTKEKSITLKLIFSLMFITLNYLYYTAYNYFDKFKSSMILIFFELIIACFIAAVIFLIDCVWRRRRR
jgi:hypothetical protein